jgi:hypothetical protein
MTNLKGEVSIMTWEGKGDMIGMMSKMMQGDKPEMMMEIMSQCLEMMFQNMQKKDRIAFTLKMVSALMEQTYVGMSEEEKKDFVAKVVEKVKA